MEYHYHYFLEYFTSKKSKTVSSFHFLAYCMYKCTICTSDISCVTSIDLLLKITCQYDCVQMTAFHIKVMHASNIRREVPDEGPSQETSKFSFFIV